MNRSLKLNLIPFLRGTALQRGAIFGGILFVALLSFEIFNFSTTQFALLDILGDPQVEVRRNVSYAISRLVPPGRPASRPATGTGGPLLSPPAGGK